MNCSRGRHRAGLWVGGKVSGGLQDSRKWCPQSKFDWVKQSEMLVFQVAWEMRKGQAAHGGDPDTKKRAGAQAAGSPGGSPWRVWA